ncbi:MAG: hypothetical protein PHZ09_11085 [Eubacteriales bacterium]|jgi:hypothetical protein|nr:hypothetical protein [Eubacteriales bacterium]
MAVYYLFDDTKRKDANEECRNYWYCYITELLDRLGVTAQQLPDADRRFRKGDVLFTGPGALADADREHIARSKGLILIGLATQNADDLFGIRTGEIIPQPDGEFSINGFFRMRDGAYLPVDRNDYPLPVVSPVTVVKTNGARTLAYIDFDPGLTVFNGAYYFAFDLTQTLWTCSAGKPVYDGQNGFDIGRVCDTRIVPLDYDTEIAFCDRYLYIIQTIFARVGYPMIHRLPPMKDGAIPDLLLFFGGDDDATNGVMNLQASGIMHERGLPYHMNLMPDINGNFVTTPEEFEIIRSRGHELALHYDFVCRANRDRFIAAGFAEQLKLFADAFGVMPVSNVGHCLTQHGWAERCRYQADLGIMGDNSKLGEINPDDINAFGLYGFAFGTAFPFFAYDDWAHDNKRLNFTELVINYYEPRLPEDDPEALEKLRRCLDDAARHGRTINYFLHPHYITGLYGTNQQVMASLDETRSYCDSRNYKVLTCGPDSLCLWWHARSVSSVIGTPAGFTVYAAADIIIRIPGQGKRVTVNGVETECPVKHIDGLDWTMLRAVRGRSEVSVQ